MLAFPQYAANLDASLGSGSLTPLTAGVFLTSYVANLLSGFYIVDCFASAPSDKPTPNSYSSLTDAYLPFLTPVVISASTLINAGVLVFALYSFPGVFHEHILHDMAASQISTPRFVLESGAAAALFGGACALPKPRVDDLIKALVTSFSLAFGGLVVHALSAPGLLDGGLSTFDASPLPLDVDSASGVSPLAALAKLMPLSLLCGVYQNMVPNVFQTVQASMSPPSPPPSSAVFGGWSPRVRPPPQDLEAVKLYSKVSLAVGSAIPTAMYLLWCVVGRAGAGDSAFLDAFESLILAASSVGCIVSLAGEFEHYFTGEEGDPSSSTDRAAKTQLSPKAVAAGVAPALAVAWGARQGGEVLDLLNVMGGFLVPLLYFALPAVLLLRVGEGGKREE